MDVNERSFGILIAYVIPGWIVLLSLGHLSVTVSGWTSGPIAENATIGGFLFSTLASVGLGVLLSTVRWIIIDPIMNWAGVRSGSARFDGLRHSHQALTLLVDGHYRYYQFHANLCIAVPLATIIRWTARGFSVGEFLGLIVLLILLLAGARDALRKYHVRSHELLSAA